MEYMLFYQRQPRLGLPLQNLVCLNLGAVAQAGAIFDGIAGKL